MLSIKRPMPPLAPPPRGARRACGESTVFGLDVRASIPLPSLEGSRANPTGRRLDLTASDNGAVQAEWPPGARTICAQRGPGGSACFRIEASATCGYRIWGRGRGSYLLSANGQRLSFASEGSPRAARERFLVGQVLPFAALLSGLEIFHASAVAVDGRAVAFAGPSGAGKTSVALEALRSGAGFLADDVLALELRGGEPIAHPGTPLAGVDRGEARRLALAHRPLAGEVLSADAREQLMRVRGSQAPAPLGALFFLDRRSAGCGPPRFEPMPEARTLLACTFNLVLDTPRRMRGLLDVCAATARCRVERIVVPPHVDPGALAQAAIARASEAR